MRPPCGCWIPRGIPHGRANSGPISAPAITATRSTIYRDSRSRDGPAEFLKDFRGYLQTDAYAAYESVVLKSAGRIIPVGCWAHARRNFFDARLSQPREAHYVLGLIGQLYDIEDEIRLQGPDERKAVRQEQSVPVLDRLFDVLARAEGRRLAQEQVRASDRLWFGRTDTARRTGGAGAGFPVRASWLSADDRIRQRYGVYQPGHPHLGRNPVALAFHLTWQAHAEWLC